jgi:uncharacterized zinc-type alcohol dehydrogenase-like protein
MSKARAPCFGPDPRAEAVREKFVLAVGHKFEQLPAVAPLLCAGITMWSPLTYWNTGPASSASAASGTWG